MIVRRKRLALAGSEAERLQGLHVQLGDLPPEHFILGDQRANTVIRRREAGYCTVAYPGGVMKAYEAICGRVPDEHRIHPEGLEAHYLPEIVAPPDFSEPLILSIAQTIPPNVRNLVLIDFTVPDGREAALESAGFDLADAGSNTISFEILVGGMKLEFAQRIRVNSFQRWKSALRLDEQMRVQVLANNQLAANRFVEVSLNGWIYPIRKKVR